MRLSLSLCYLLVTNNFLYNLHRPLSFVRHPRPSRRLDHDTSFPISATGDTCIDVAVMHAFIKWFYTESIMYLGWCNLYHKPKNLSTRPYFIRLNINHWLMRCMICSTTFVIYTDLARREQIYQTGRYIRSNMYRSIYTRPLIYHVMRMFGYTLHEAFCFKQLVFATS